MQATVTLFHSFCITNKVRCHQLASDSLVIFAIDTFIIPFDRHIGGGSSSASVVQLVLKDVCSKIFPVDLFV